MADDFLDYVMDTEDQRWDYRHGGMSKEEAYEAGLIDENGDDI